MKVTVEDEIVHASLAELPDLRLALPTKKAAALGLIELTEAPPDIVRMDGSGEMLFRNCMWQNGKLYRTYRNPGDVFTTISEVGIPYADKENRKAYLIDTATNGRSVTMIMSKESYTQSSKQTPELVILAVELHSS